MGMNIVVVMLISASASSGLIMPPVNQHSVDDLVAMIHQLNATLIHQSATLIQQNLSQAKQESINKQQSIMIQQLNATLTQQNAALMQQNLTLARQENINIQQSATIQSLMQKGSMYITVFPPL